MYPTGLSKKKTRGLGRLFYIISHEATEKLYVSWNCVVEENYLRFFVKSVLSYLYDAIKQNVQCYAFHLLQLKMFILTYILMVTFSMFFSK